MNTLKNKKFKPIYKRDNKGNVRVWKAEAFQDTQDDPNTAFIRTISGIDGMSLVTSKWKKVQGKNVGRSNETSPWSQAQLEIDSMYTDRKSKGYFDDVNDIDTFGLFKPMLADKYEKRPIKWDQVECVFAQPKLDGIRCIARADGLWTRNGKPITSCPHIWEALQPLFNLNPDVVLDGELYNHELKDDFNKIASLVRKSKPTDEDTKECARLVQYHFYDALSDTDQFPQRLDTVFLDLHSAYSSEVGRFPTQVIQQVPTYPAPDQETLDILYQRWLEDGYEGQMIRYDAPYEHKRSKNLLKRKEFMDQEFEVADVEEGIGNWAGAVKRFKVKLPEDSKDETSDAGVRGTYEQLAALLESGKKPDWATVRFQGWTPDGSLRFPVVVDYGYGERND